MLDYRYSSFRSSGHRKTVFANWDADQKAMSESIGRILEPYFRTGQLDTLIDCGCGSGEVLAGIIEYANESGWSDKLNEVVGIDSDPGEIACCETKFGSLLCSDEDRANTIRWVQADLGDRGQLRSLAALSSRCAAFLFVGHTAQHLGKKTIEKFLDYMKPDLLLVDQCRDWEAVIDALGSSPVVVDPIGGIRRPSDPVYWRHTACTSQMEEGDTEVQRRVIEGTEERVGELLSVTQHALTLSNLTTSLRTAGSYVCIGENAYSGGWGEMEACIYLRTCSFRNEANKVHEQLVEGLVRGIVSPRSHLEDSLGFFRHCFVCSIMPFFTLISLARYVNLRGEAELLPPRDIMIHNEMLPLAAGPVAGPGFYGCLQGPIGAPCIIRSYVGADGGDITAFKDYEVIENKYIDSTRIDWSEDDAEAEQSSDEEISDLTGTPFFIIPIYVGSLPLFCLGVSMPSTLKPEVTTWDTFQTFAYNITMQLKDALREVDLSARYFQPMANKLRVVWTELLRREPDSRLDDYAEDLFDVALNKPWKSPVEFMPHVELRYANRVDYENKQVREAWKHAWAQISIIDLISDWTRGARFFHHSKKDLGHEMPVRAHKDKLAVMETHASLAILDGGAKCLETVAGWMNVGVEEPRLKWAVGELSKLRGLIHEYYTKEGFWTGSAEDDALKEATKQARRAFDRLKAVLCKDGNDSSDGHFRFSKERLQTLLRVALGGGIQGLSWPDSIAVKPLPIIGEVPDPTELLVDVGRQLMRLELSSCSVSLTDQNDAYGLKVVFNIGKKFIRLGGGDSDELRDLLTRLSPEKEGEIGKAVWDQLTVEVKTKKDTNNQALTVEKIEMTARDRGMETFEGGGADV